MLVEYHTNTSTREQVFSARSTVSKNTATSFVLTTCVRRTSDVTAQAMVLTEIGVPSGYEVSQATSDYGSASHVEFLEGKVVLYYASVSSVGWHRLLLMLFSSCSFFFFLFCVKIS